MTEIALSIVIIANVAVMVIANQRIDIQRTMIDALIKRVKELEDYQHAIHNAHMRNIAQIDELHYRISRLEMK